jgi:hypothetical protein
MFDDPKKKRGAQKTEHQDDDVSEAEKQRQKEAFIRKLAEIRRKQGAGSKRAEDDPKNQDT